VYEDKMISLNKNDDPTPCYKEHLNLEYYFNENKDLLLENNNRIQANVLVVDLRS